MHRISKLHSIYQFSMWKYQIYFFFWFISFLMTLNCHINNTISWVHFILKYPKYPINRHFYVKKSIQLKREREEILKYIFLLFVGLIFPDNIHTMDVFTHFFSLYKSTLDASIHLFVNSDLMWFFAWRYIWWRKCEMHLFTITMSKIEF